ncbi:hypothetical protein B0H19DRAFT_1065458 [Mycena capillaripes]|nr:hypothetical protein B0H19DRAFT_1065458 [Mycena capillaripes]
MCNTSDAEPYLTSIQASAHPSPSMRTKSRDTRLRRPRHPSSTSTALGRRRHQWTRLSEVDRDTVIVAYTTQRVACRPVLLFLRIPFTEGRRALIPVWRMIVGGYKGCSPFEQETTVPSHRQLAQKPHEPHAAFVHCAKPRDFSSLFLIFVLLNVQQWEAIFFTHHKGITQAPLPFSTLSRLPRSRGNAEEVPLPTAPLLRISSLGPVIFQICRAALRNAKKPHAARAAFAQAV